MGPATVFRRFPTKDDLMLAVIARRVEEIRDVFAEELKADDPGEAFFRAMRRIADLHLATPGLHKCVARCGDKPGAAALVPLSEKLVSRAQKAGGVRRDVKPADVSTLIRSVMQSAPENLEIVLDGLRATSAKPPSRG